MQSYPSQTNDQLSEVFSFNGLVIEFGNNPFTIIPPGLVLSFILYAAIRDIMGNLNHIRNWLWIFRVFVSSFAIALSLCIGSCLLKFLLLFLSLPILFISAAGLSKSKGGTDD